MKKSYYELIENGTCYSHNSFEKCREGLEQAYQNAEEALEEKGWELWQLEIQCVTYDSTCKPIACEVVHEFEVPTREDEIDESMDGDFDSAMTSAGLGTDEDYGYFGD
tara:strand:- start:826 stop:1149 length:324 start_codon:yes stop_codon:yes gene_type:complete